MNHQSEDWGTEVSQSNAEVQPPCTSGLRWMWGRLHCTVYQFWRLCKNLNAVYILYLYMGHTRWAVVQSPAFTVCLPKCSWARNWTALWLALCMWLQVELVDMSTNMLHLRSRKARYSWWSSVMLRVRIITCAEGRVVFNSLASYAKVPYCRRADCQVIWICWTFLQNMVKLSWRCTRFRFFTS